MDITEVSLRLERDVIQGLLPPPRLQALASIIIDDAVTIRLIKVIRRDDGGVFLAFPCIRVHRSCPTCHSTTPYRSNYCPHCGLALEPLALPVDKRGRPFCAEDIAYPVNRPARAAIEGAVVPIYERELVQARAADYPGGWLVVRSSGGEECRRLPPFAAAE